MKKVLLVGAVLIVLLVGVLVVGVSNLGPIIKNAVNTYGPQMTKTELKLADVDISLLSGKAELQGFFLGNPKGFTSAEAMRVGSIFIDIDPKSITKDTIVIHAIEVMAPSITYERRRRTDNFKAIIHNIDSASEPAAPSKESSKGEASSGPGKKILIEDFVLKQGTVTLATSLQGGKKISTQLPDIHLKNIGGTGGASSRQVTEEIFRAIYKEIISGAVTEILNTELKALEKNLGTAGGDVEKETQGILKGLFGN